MSFFRLPVGRITADYYQTPHSTPDLDPAAAVIRAFTGARHTIRFAIYSFTHKGIADSLIAAHERGVDIRGIADASELKVSTSQIRRLVDAGIDIRKWGSAWHLAHDKALIVDGDTSRAVAGLGSYNWTVQATTANLEVLLIAHGLQVSRKLGPALTRQIETAYQGGSAI